MIDVFSIMLIFMINSLVQMGAQPLLIGFLAYLMPLVYFLQNNFMIYEILSCYA